MCGNRGLSSWRDTITTLKDLNSETIKGLTEALLLQSYDAPEPVPEFHKEMWDMCCDDYPFVAIAAPRKHAKSTAITHALSLAAALFRAKKNIMILSNTEEQAIGFLSGIKQELTENEELTELFDIAKDANGRTKFDKEGEKQIVVRFKDGNWFRIFVKGAGQRMRGAIYRHVRPDLIICDDLEDDSTVKNDDLRKAFRKWFLATLLPVRSKNGHVRVVGTILHMDSLLLRLIKSKEWKSLIYKAHKSFNDFSNILWPGQWDEESLRREQSMYIEDGEGYLYSMEYLNDPTDFPDKFLTEEDLVPMTEDDYNKITLNYSGVDFAISEQQSGDFNVFVVVGYDENGDILIKFVQKERGLDGQEIIDSFFWLNKILAPEIFFVEKGQIFQSLEGVFINEMEKRGEEILYEEMTPYRDKLVRAKPLQKLFRQGRVRIDMEAEWWPDLKKELLEFPRGKHDDQVDALAWLAIGILYLVESPNNEEMEEEQWEDAWEEANIYIGQEKARPRYLGRYA